MKNMMMTFCLIVTIIFIWIWHHQTQFNDHSRRGLFLLKNNELEPAVSAYTKAIQHKKNTWFFPQEPSVYNNLGLVYLKQAQYEKAVIAFQKASSLKPESQEAYINLATTYLKQGIPNLAIEFCERAIRISPHNAATHYNLACAYALKSDNQKAMGSLNRAVALDPRMQDLAKHEPAFDNLESHKSFSFEND